MKNSEWMCESSSEPSSRGFDSLLLQTKDSSLESLPGLNWDKSTQVTRKITVESLCKSDLNADLS